jgi:hypothetical protein
MQVSPRRLGPNETDHELIWLAVSLGSLACAATWLWLGLPWPQCAFHALTGFPCLTCGATRCAIQFFHGHFLAALRWNPLVFAFLSAFSIFDAYAFTVLITRSHRLRIAHPTFSDKIVARGVVLTLLAANWAYLLAHSRKF